MSTNMLITNPLANQRRVENEIFNTLHLKSGFTRMDAQNPRLIMIPITYAPK